MSLTIKALSTVHNTFVLERHYPATPERVFAALSEPAKKRRWLLENAGNSVEDFQMDFRVGGSERASSRFQGGPFAGTLLSSESTYHDIVPMCRVVLASTMSMGDHRISAALTTFELVPTDSGTTLIFTHQGAFFEGSDGPQMREAGWRKLLDRMDAEVMRHA